MKQLGQHAPPRHVIAHLSDPHLLAGGVRQYGAVDTEAGLRLSLERLARVDPPPQALVFTGDLADKAEPAAYARLREIVEPAAAAMGAVVVWVIGNHDERADYARELFGQASDEPQDRVHEVDGLRIISLDSSVPGYHHGELSDEQLAWLADVLATPAEHGTLIALHHPPIPLPMLRAAELIELLDQDRFAAVVRGTDVRGILAGHLHFSTYSLVEGIPVSVASASCYTVDPTPVDRFVSGVDGGQAFTMVHAYADRLVHTIVPLVPGPEVSGIGLDIMEAIEGLSVEEARELASSKTSPFNTQLEGDVTT
ncbi:metallophosphoesterase [Nocardioides sp. CF8]|uniref:metallophosphoesterase n=1 Tax=Nocardioides sp. CF8 TaxID=110319 RepID=UPI000330B315|nr:metallophosphoesterase [Nocardioides sp. CF8]EON25461.1 metallophosphoesterase [Nocardioides sp. CF8]